jgi:transglutaminase-like putative cysteine protease
MRLRIAHSIVHHYDPPAKGVIQVLRLTPRNHEGQYVIGWRIDVSADARLNAHEDAFGNLTHVFTADGPLDALSVKVDGEVETQNTDGVVRGTLERFPPSLFLRGTPLTEPDQAIRDFAKDIRAADGGNVLGELHALMDQLHDETTCENDPLHPTALTAADAFARKRGASRDLAHIFIGAAHSLQIPARYVAGYCCTDGTAEQDSDHAWAEAFVPDLGWVGFDPANRTCPTDAYVRVAIGLDALGAAPMRGTRYGTGGETLAVAIKVDQ